MAKKIKKKKAANGRAPKVAKGPRQQSLPGMEDRAVKALDNLALRYDEVKKARMELTRQEVEAKKKVRDAMHKLKRKNYRHNNITIELVPEGEKVKVKVRGVDLDEEEPEVQAAADAAEVEEAEIEDSEDEEIPEAVSEL